MADTEIMETPTTRPMIPDFNAELSEVIRMAFPDVGEMEDLLLRRKEKGLLDDRKE